MGEMLKLKKAEEEATKMIDAARKERTATLRKARAEADAEIKKYQQQQTEKLEQARLALASDDDVLSKLSGKTDQDIEVLKQDCGKNKDAVVSRLLEVVTTVNKTVPEARKGVKAK